ncbi:MAG: aminotransferase DegT [Verrucomicrobia bacterium TMED44]|nr:MAG: aminotransferase DegT [Verrucomicrobia bacterium TMED44]
MKIDFANLQTQYQKYKSDIDANIHAVLKQSNYIMGDQVKQLERELSLFTGAKYTITCSNGSDALLLALMAIDIKPGDEIITTPFTFISTAESIASLKAKPVFVDIEKDTFNIDANQIEAVITEKTKGIMPVSLFGQPADMQVIQNIAQKHNLKVIIDGAQSFGSTYNGKTDSNLGNISTTSFFPSKPFGCYGDGGAVFTNNDKFAEKIKMLRVHGQNKRYHYKHIGMGGRLDTIQAAILLAKLPHYKKELEERERVAKNYSNELKSSIILPTIRSNRSGVWAQYTVRVNNRDEVQKKLQDNGIPTAIYYPVPLHLQECLKYLNYKKADFPAAEEASKLVLSLPMNAYLSEDNISYITKTLNNI